MSSVADSTAEVLGQLSRQIEQLHLAGRPQGLPPVSSGLPELDRLLPEGGLARGTLVEWVAAAPGSGAGTLALLTAREACRAGRPLVIVDHRQWFYPPAAAAWGIHPQQIILVQAGNEADTRWAIDQALRSPEVGAVWSYPERLDPRTFRRWQLAVEAGTGLGLLVRPRQACHEPSWADIRLLVGESQTAQQTEPADRSRQTGWRLRIELLRARGESGRAVEIELP